MYAFVSIPPVRPPMMRPAFVPHILQRPSKMKTPFSWVYLLLWLRHPLLIYEEMNGNLVIVQWSVFSHGHMSLSFRLQMEGGCDESLNTWNLFAGGQRLQMMRAPPVAPPLPRPPPPPPMVLPPPSQGPTPQLASQPIQHMSAAPQVGS